MNASEIRELRDDELRDRLDDLEKQLFGLRSQAVTEKLENSHAIGNARRNIARVKTIMREKQLQGE
ncbi:MAG: 50S ribosomal protein L29 [Planctomycetes bacterium]|nr:50S ribosomal protein L29 [Planctomycetota bacterium]